MNPSETMSLEGNQDVSVSNLERHEFSPEPFIQFVISHFSIWEALGWSSGGWLVTVSVKESSQIHSR